MIPKLFEDAQPLVQPLDPRAAASGRRAARGRADSQTGGAKAALGGSAGVAAEEGPVDARLRAALDFKMDKSGDYTRGALQGACNAMTMTEAAREFVLPGASHPPREVRRLHFDALVIAEGEWSTTCNLLGITKVVARFATAIGLIVNMRLEPSHPSSLRSFVATGVAPQLAALGRAGLACENLEYLRGATHYLAATLKKKTLLSRGVLRHDVSGPAMLAPSNVDIDALAAVGRELADLVGIPPSAQFADFHPV